MSIEYTREHLVDLCERSIRPMSAWHDRDSASAHEQVGRAWALLRADAPFAVLTEGEHCVTSDRIVWVRIEWEGFGFHDYGGDLERGTFYIPTALRLDEAGDSDWY